jgi:hypothetical protein
MLSGERFSILGEPTPGMERPGMLPEGKGINLQPRSIKRSLQGQKGKKGVPRRRESQAKGAAMGASWVVLIMEEVSVWLGRKAAPLGSFRRYRQAFTGV